MKDRRSSQTPHPTGSGGSSTAQPGGGSAQDGKRARACTGSAGGTSQQRLMKWRARVIG